MDRSILRRMFFVALAFLFIFNVMGAAVAVGDKPPWAQDNKNKDKDKGKDPPVSAPEPSALSLIGVAAGALIGYRLRKRLSGFRPKVRKDGSDPAETRLHVGIPESQTGQNRRNA